MGFEATPPNGFRASLRGDKAPELAVAEKRDRAQRGAGGLGGIKVARSESRTSNQRDSDRHRLADEQAVIRRKGKKHVVQLINLSHGGAMVAGSFKAKLWDKVELVLGEGGGIECAVRWMRDDKFGLEFAHETQVDCDPQTHDDLLRQVIHNSFPDVEVAVRPVQPEEQEKRVATRHPLIWKGIVHHDYEWYDVRLRNISASGALIECSTSLPVGVTVFLDLGETGRIGSTVSWSRGNQSGLSFHNAFDVRTLAKSTPDVAAINAAKPHFAPYGRGCDQSPWAPQWNRASLDELANSLGG